MLKHEVCGSIAVPNYARPYEWICVGLSTEERVNALDCTTEAARQKLARLDDEGTVDKRKSGRTAVYWRRDE